MNRNRTLIIRYARTNESGTEKKVSIPLSAFRFAEKLLPVKLRELIAENNVDMSVFADFGVGKIAPETLIEIENASGRLVLSVE